eukprot:gene30198-37369_t
MAAHFVEKERRKLDKIAQEKGGMPDMSFEETVNLSHNYIVEPSALEHLKECPSITNLDITHNKLEANEEFINIFKAVPNIVALSINGNEVTKLPLFRKRMVANNLNMGYLDRPVDEQERLFATAFMEGGADAEAAARQKWKDDQNTKRINEANVFREWQAEQARIREAARREGRPVHNAITPFTPEEEAQRAAEAQAAGDAERAMLGLGIERLGTRFHQIDENAARGVDPLEA